MNKKQIKNWLGLTKEYENISEQVKLCDEIPAKLPATNVFDSILIS